MTDLVCTLIRDDGANLVALNLGGPLTDLEGHLMLVREAAQNHANSVPAPPSTWSVTKKNSDHYEPLLLQSIQVAGVAVQDPALMNTQVVVPGPLEPSIWDSTSETWETIEGATAEVDVEQTDPTATGSPSPLAQSGNTYYLSLKPEGLRNPPVRSCSYCFPSAAPAKTEGVVLFFTYTRSQVVGIRSCGPLPQVHSAKQTFKDNRSAWTVRWRSDQDQTSPICLTIDYTGDPPHVRDWTWLVPSGEDDPIPCPQPGRGRPIPAPPSHVHANQDQALQGFVLTFEEELKIREKLVDETKVHQEDKRFFLEMDRLTNPASGHQHALSFLRLGAYLSNRYLRRGERASYGQKLITPNIEAESWRKDATAVSDLLVDLMQIHYPASNAAGIDLQQVRDSFLRFGGGELTVFATHGAPNGTNIFCFAELADLLVRLKVKSKVWKPLFTVFVQMCRIFASSYYSCDPSTRSICAYRVDHNPVGKRAWRQDWKDALGKDWAHIPSWVYADLVHATLAAEFDGPFAPHLEIKNVGCGPGGVDRGADLGRDWTRPGTPPPIDV